MSYAFVHDVPADAAMYAEIRAKLPDEPPKGLICHVALGRSGGLRYVDVWESEADWDRFRTEHVDPAVDAVLSGHGLPHDDSLSDFQVAELVDAWVQVP